MGKNGCACAVMPLDEEDVCSVYMLATYLMLPTPRPTSFENFCVEQLAKQPDLGPRYGVHLGPNTPCHQHPAITNFHPDSSVVKFLQF